MKLGKTADEGRDGGVAHLVGDLLDGQLAIAQQPAGVGHAGADQLFPEAHTVALLQKTMQLPGGQGEFFAKVLFCGVFAEMIYKKIWETYLNPCIRDIENHRGDACKARYMDMVMELKGRYII